MTSPRYDVGAMPLARSPLRLLAATLLVVCACAVGPFGRRDEPDPARVAASLASGKVVYHQYCAPCHGATGLGDGPLASEYDPPPTDLVSPGWHVSVKNIEVVIATPHYSSRLIKQRVESGVREMPAWNEILTAQQIDDVTAYVRSLAR